MRGVQVWSCCVWLLAGACSSKPQAAAQPVQAAREEPRPAKPPPAPLPQRTVTLVVLKSFPADLQQVVAQSVERAWNLRVDWAKPMALPKATYYSPRKRYRADLLTDHLATLAPPGQLIFGMTEVDVSATKGKNYDWGVIGLAHIGGPAGLLSLHRIVPSASGPEQIKQRVGVIAAHELGHMFGLQHCEELGCIMRDAEGKLTHVDESHGQLGPECQARLRSLGFAPAD